MPLLSNASGSLPFSNFLQEAERRMLAGEADSFIYIVPNRIAQRRIERQLVETAAGRSIANANILTLADFANSLMLRAFPRLRTISDSETGIFIEQSIRELLKADSLKYFERKAGQSDAELDAAPFPFPRGTFELVVNTIREMKEAGVYPERIRNDLGAAIQRKGNTTETRRAQDIHEIYDAYEKKLSDVFIDTNGQFLKLNGRYAVSPLRSESESITFATSDFRGAFPKVRDIFIEGFIRLEHPTFDLLAAISRIDGVRMTLDLDYQASNPELFATIGELIHRLDLCGFCTVECSGPLFQTGSKEIAEWQRSLASSLYRSELPAEKCDANFVELQPAPTLYEEVEQIARKIKELLFEHPEIREDLSQIVIATPIVGNYTPVFEEVFKRHEIPAFIADRHHLDRSQLMMSLLALFDIVRYGLRRKEVLRALSSPYFHFQISAGNVLDSRNLIQIISKYKLTGSLKESDAWRNSLQVRVSALDETIKSTEDELEAKQAASEQQHLLKAIGDLTALAEILNPLRDQMRPSRFCSVVKKLITRLEVGRRLLGYNSNTLATQTLELDTRGYRTLLKLLEDLESLFSLMEANGEKKLHSLDYYVDRLRAAALWARYNPRPRSGAVLVTSLEQSIGQPADYLFVGGLTETTLPSVYEPQVFLMDSMQRGERTKLLEERLQFYRGITNFRKRLFLSYPIQNENLKLESASSFLNSLRDVAAIKVHDSAAGNSIYSYRDLYEKVGRSLEANSDYSVSEVLDKIPSLPSDRQYVGVLREHFPVALTSMRARTAPGKSIYRGWVDRDLLTDDERARLDAYTTHVWSVTQLELYAKCAFQYYAKQVLALNGVEDAEEGLNPLEKGSMLHEILRKYMTQRRDRNQVQLSDLPSEEFDSAFEEIQLVASEHLASSSGGHPFWRLDSEFLMKHGNPDHNPLGKFIKHEQGLTQLHTRPEYFEVSFGSKTGKASENDQRLSREMPVQIGGVKLRGKIDRIDISTEHFTILDYKSGNTTPSLNDIKRGTSLQLPLYLKIAEDLLRSHFPNLIGVGAFYHKLVDKGNGRKLGIVLSDVVQNVFKQGIKKTSSFLSSEELEQLIEDTVTKAEGYVQGVSAGVFPLVAKDLVATCNYCSYKSVCRVKEAIDLDLLADPPTLVVKE